MAPDLPGTIPRTRCLTDLEKPSHLSAVIKFVTETIIESAAQTLVAARGDYSTWTDIREAVISGSHFFVPLTASFHSSG